MAALEAPAPVTVIVHYAPPEGGGAPFRLRLVVPGNKSVGALAKAFAKTVAKTRTSVPPIDLADHYCARRDEAANYLNPGRSVGEALADGEAVDFVRREAPPPKEEAPEMPKSKPGASVFRDTAFFCAASVGVPDG